MLARSAAVLGIAAGLALAACAPIPDVVDTPKTGDTVALSVKQPLQVRWSNLTPNAGEWVLETPAPKSVAVVRRTRQPPANGAMELDIFDFVGAKPGADKLTFAYQRKDGSAPDAGDRVTIDVKVS